MEFEGVEAIDPFVGKVLLDRYSVVKKIGKGAYGAVYAAKDLYLGNGSIALKILFPKALRSSNAPKRLAQEIQAANRIDHENIVRFYDFFWYEDLCVISMEFADGFPLRKYIDERIISDYVSIADICRQMCTGLQVIHNHGIIHRDLKPDNIILAENHLVKITDFGIAHLIEGDDSKIVSEEDVSASSDALSNGEEAKRKKQLVGTMRYISPESLSKGVYDQRSDIYALGVILYEMIVGKYLFEYRNFKELIKIKIKRDPVSPAYYRQDCPAMLERICIKALQRDPENRYQNTEEMLEDLKLLKLEFAGSSVEVNSVASDSNLQVADVIEKQPTKFLSILLIIESLLFVIIFGYICFVSFAHQENPNNAVIQNTQVDGINITIGEVDDEF